MPSARRRQSANGGLPRSFLARRHLVVHRVPRASTPPTCCPAGRRLPPGTAGRRRPHGTTIVALTFPGGVVMAGDRRATMGNVIAQRDIEKVFPADEYSLRRHRRHRRPGRRAGPAVPGRARALREDRGHPAVARRQGQPARHDDPRQPRAGHAGPGRRPAVRRLRPTRPTTGPDLLATTSPAAATRSTSYHAVGSGSLFARGSLKKLYRADLAARRGGRACAVAGALRRRRRRLRHRRARTWPGGSSRWSPSCTAAGLPPAPRRRARRRRRPRSSPAARSRPDGPTAPLG